MQFSDVPEGQWHSEAVRWAASEKLVSGYGDGSVDQPNSAGQCRLDGVDAGFPVETVCPQAIERHHIAMTAFADVPTDAWYAEAVAYCQQNGIMSGTTDTKA